jgi:branched-chain amino acid aminotransferase
MAKVTGEAIWLDGEFVAWDAARVHVLTHTLHYGLGVFEGIRCYQTADGRSACSGSASTCAGLYDSAHINLMKIPYERAKLEQVCLETLRRNHLPAGYLRPLVFVGDGEMGLNPGGNAIRVASSRGRGASISEKRGSSAASAPRSPRSAATS